MKMQKPKEILMLEEYWGVEIYEKSYTTDVQGNIVWLMLHELPITDLSPIAYLKCLEGLFISNWLTPIKELRLLPIQESINLKYLSIDNGPYFKNKIGISIPDVSIISNLFNLEDLRLNGCCINNLEWTISLGNLRVLYAIGNELEDIEPLLYLPKLERANLSHNKINTIPKEIVEVLDYKFLFLDRFVEDLPKKYCNLHNNPLQSPPVHIVAEGREAMLEWWNRKEKEEMKPLNEVRVMFLGWGEAGKTSVMRRVKGEIPTQGDEDSTHGINLVPWQHTTPNGQQVKVNLWDFGGQEIQHHTHQFFLATDCIYVVVVNNRENDEPRYWLEFIRTMANDAPTILLFNKADQARNARHNVAELRQEYPFIKHDFEIIAAQPKTPLHAEQKVFFDENVTAFRAALERLIETHDFVAVSQYPRTTFEVKEWVENEIQLGKNFISKKAFRLACESREVNRIEQESWLGVFKKIGIVAYIEKNLHLDKLLILNPEWVTFAVYRILLHPKTKALQGIITKDDLAELLYQDTQHRAAFYRKYTYTEDDYANIIELMKEYKLCYTKDNYTLIIPGAFPNNYRSPLEDRTDGLRLRFKFEKFLPPSLLNTLIVGLMERQKVRKSWATGIEVFDYESDTEALVKTDSFLREINITVFGECSRELLTLIRAEIKQIKRTFSEALAMNEQVPIPRKENEWVSYEKLLNLERRGVLTYQGDDGDYSVKKLLENIEIPLETSIAEIVAILEEILTLIQADHQWRHELLEVIGELNEVSKSPISSEKVRGLSLRKIFEGMKDGKDAAEMLVLTPDFAEKWAKLLAAYELIKQTYGW